MREKIDSYIGFAAKSRKLISGTETCKAFMARGKVKLLIIAEDISENTKEKVIREAVKNSVEYRIFSNKDRLSAITGETDTGVFGILDDNFKNVILKEIESKEVF